MTLRRLLTWTAALVVVVFAPVLVDLGVVLLLGAMWISAEHDLDNWGHSRERRETVKAGAALADAVRGLDSYAALGGAPIERTTRADAALRAWNDLA